MSMSNDEGKAFESSVAELLSLAGYETRHELLIGHKKVDLLAEERRLGSHRRIAVECKAHSRPLTRTQLTSIYADYLPLLQANLVDELLVVTKHGVTPSGNTLVLETRELSHLTFSELQASVMDFRSYLAGLVSEYEQDGLNTYYVPPMTTDRRDLEELVGEWLTGSQGSRPLAILGSYGMGKTTFARRMSYVLAQRALDDSTQPMPILLPLGEISGEQTLEGLLGKAFTARAVVRNYTFGAFMQLNALGRFVVFLDGFDEMKHMLSWDDFRYDFRQLNRLVGPCSHVVLLGRPTAFLTDHEHMFALHGIRHIRGTKFRDPDWPDYEEVEIGPFDRRQVVSFLENYLEHKASQPNVTHKQRRTLEMARTQIDKVSGKQLSDIARRPVQLRMLAEVLPQWQGDLSSLTVAILYSVFIDMILEREQGKLARSRFKAVTRRRFASRLAWWLWRSKTNMGIATADIPESLLEGFCQDSEDMEAVRRDLVSAAFLERKLGGTLYFPHRSFQEFLVAELLLDAVAKGEVSVNEADAAMTDEVAMFLQGLVNITTFAAWEPAFSRYRGMLTWRFAQLWISEEGYMGYLLKKLKATDNPWYVLFLTLGVADGVDSGWVSPWAFVSVLLKKMAKASDPAYALLCYLGVVGTSQADPSNTRSYRDTERTIIRALLELTRLGEPVEVTRTVKGKRKTIREHRPYELIRQFFSTVAIRPKGKRRASEGCTIDLSASYRFLCSALSNYCLISNWVLGATIRTADIHLPTRLTVSGVSEIDSIVSFQKEHLRAGAQ